MIKCIGPRYSGKTTSLLKLAAEKGYILVEPNYYMAEYVRNMAKELKLKGVQIISAHEMLYHLPVHLSQKYLIDELEMFLHKLGVAGYSDLADDGGIENDSTSL